MSLFIASLNSGSNGNCYYVGNEEEAVLVDAGISCRETEIRMARIGLSMKKVRAIFVSHEHSDHINGVTVLSRKYALPVYITPPTLQNSSLRLNPQLIFSFIAYAPILIGGLTISAFPKFHDAAHAHSFIVKGGDVTVGVFTDIGVACEHLTGHFAQCHAAFLEANYDEEMLRKGRYPAHLKRRISGGLGHLSNSQALSVFTAHRPVYMSHLLLSHLSRDNNDPRLAQELFNTYAGGTNIIVASRYQETGVFHIDGKHVSTPVEVQLPERKEDSQYTLF